MAATSRTRLGLVEFRECQGLFCGKISSENQGNFIQKLREISNALWMRDMVSSPE